MRMSSIDTLAGVERMTLMKNYDTQSRPSRKRSQAHLNLDGAGVDDLDC